MKTILCILALFVLSASTADAYVRRTIGGGYVVRGAGVYSGRYAGGYYGGYAAGGDPGYYGGYAHQSYVTGRPTLIPRYYGGGW